MERQILSKSKDESEGVSRQEKNRTLENHVVKSKVPDTEYFHCSPDGLELESDFNIEGDTVLTIGHIDLVLLDPIKLMLLGSQLYDTAYNNYNARDIEGYIFISKDYFVNSFLINVLFRCEHLLSAMGISSPLEFLKPFSYYGTSNEIDHFIEVSISKVQTLNTNDAGKVVVPVFPYYIFLSSFTRDKFLNEFFLYIEGSNLVHKKSTDKIEDLSITLKNVKPADFQYNDHSRASLVDDFCFKEMSDYAKQYHKRKSIFNTSFGTWRFKGIIDRWLLYIRHIVFSDPPERLMKSLESYIYFSKGFDLYIYGYWGLFSKRYTQTLKIGDNKIILRNILDLVGGRIEFSPVTSFYTIYINRKFTITLVTDILSTIPNHPLEAKILRMLGWNTVPAPPCYHITTYMGTVFLMDDISNFRSHGDDVIIQ